VHYRLSECPLSVCRADVGMSALMRRPMTAGGREAPHVPALTPTERLAMQRHVSHGREDGNGAGQQRTQTALNLANRAV
jgi:hypothetical protein